MKEKKAVVIIMFVTTSALLQFVIMFTGNVLERLIILKKNDLKMGNNKYSGRT